MNAPMSRSLIAPTSNAVLERALREKLSRRAERIGSLGELEPLAVRIGLMQNSLKPRFHDPQLLIFAADHGLAVEGIRPPQGLMTHDLVRHVLEARMPLAVFARMQQVRTVVIDAGIADNMAAHERLLVRKIAYGTRNLRNAQAMTVEQAHAAIRAGMEIGDTLPGNVMMCAGVGVGSGESAALVLSRLADAPARDLLLAGSNMSADQFALLMTIAQASQARHRDVIDPVEVVAAFGGFEIAMMAGAMLIGASKRRLLMIDGLPALAALMLASRIAPPVTDYCVFCRSHQHQGLDHGLALFRASALLELGMNSTDGTGATLAWPLVANAAALVTDVPEGEEPGPTLPQAIDIIEDPLRR